MSTVHQHGWLERIPRGSWDELRNGIRSSERELIGADLRVTVGVCAPELERRDIVFGPVIVGRGDLVAGRIVGHVDERNGRLQLRRAGGR